MPEAQSWHWGSEIVDKRKKIKYTVSKYKRSENCSKYSVPIIKVSSYEFDETDRYYLKRGSDDNFLDNNKAARK